MNEFGETPSVHVWPDGHEEGQPFPEDFWDRVDRALISAGIDWERV